MSKILQSLLAEDISDKIIKDPQRAKQLGIAYRHDRTFPLKGQAKLGPKPTDADVAKLWGPMLDQTLANTQYGDLTRDFKFADWLTKLYTGGGADWEDISGEGGDALGAWHALSLRGLLDKRDQDLNRFKTLGDLQKAMRRESYQTELNRIRNAAKIEQMKRDARDIVLVDDDKYWAAIPMNYGACYTFNNAMGYNANFCTGSSSGASWFGRYAPDGPLVMVVDKANADKADGKWQMHTATNQLVNADQDRRYDMAGNDQQFSKLFPGLMRRIGAAMLAKKQQIADASAELMKRPYDVPKSVSELKAKFPASWASKAKDEPDDVAEPEIGAPAGTLAVPEEYRQYLAPNFENKLNLTNTTLRDLVMVNAAGERKYVRASDTASAFNSAWTQEGMRDWIRQGGITKLAKYTSN